MVSTLKRLFAVSRNRCAFPGCSVTAYDAEADEIWVEVCHIEGARPGSPRHRVGQSDCERHGFGNLVLMCGHHHNVIDSDEEMYTVERLVAIKGKHELPTSEAGTPSDDNLIDRAVTQLLVNYVTVTVDTVIWSQNQLGGQIARTIINEVAPPWGLGAAALAKLTEELRSFTPRSCTLKHVQGDPDSTRFAHHLRTALEAGGWSVEGQAMLGPRTPQGVQVGLAGAPNAAVPKEVAALVLHLWHAKLLAEPVVIPDPSCTTLTIIIGHRPLAE